MKKKNDVRLIDTISNVIPCGHYWAYLHTFVEILIYMFGAAVVLVLTFVLMFVPLVMAIFNDNAFILMWYFLTIPSFVVAIKFIAYHLGWDKGI